MPGQSNRPYRLLGRILGCHRNKPVSEGNRRRGRPLSLWFQQHIGTTVRHEAKRCGEKTGLKIIPDKMPGTDRNACASDSRLQAEIEVFIDLTGLRYLVRCASQGRPGAPGRCTRARVQPRRIWAQGTVLKEPVDPVGPADRPDPFRKQ